MIVLTDAPDAPSPERDSWLFLRSRITLAALANLDQAGRYRDPLVLMTGRAIYTPEPVTYGAVDGARIGQTLTVRKPVRYLRSQE